MDTNMASWEGHWASPVVNSYFVWTAREKSASFLSGEKSASRDIAKAVVSSVEWGYRNALLQMTWELKSTCMIVQYPTLDCSESPYMQRLDSV